MTKDQIEAWRGALTGLVHLLNKQAQGQLRNADKMDGGIQELCDLALKGCAPPEVACMRIPRSLAERTEAMFRSVDPQGFIALEWANALQNGGVSPADAGAPLPGSTPGASAPSPQLEKP